jgi:hypothetical protein
MFESWKPLSDPPSESGYILLACQHHDIPVVLMGHCLIGESGIPRFRENTYNGNGLRITHWMPLPKHPYEK